MHESVDLCQALAQPARRRNLRALLAVVPACLLSPAARAHHGWSAFDESQPVWIEGTVKSVKWQNPHVELVLDAMPAKSGADAVARRAVPQQTLPVDGAALLARAQPVTRAGSWTLELAPLFRMNAWGVTEPKPGDAVAALGYAPGGKPGLMRVEFLYLGDRVYGLRSMPVKS